MPATNTKFWSSKFCRTVARDRKTLASLREIEWSTEVIWECELETGINRLIETLADIARAAE